MLRTAANVVVLILYDGAWCKGSTSLSKSENEVSGSSAPANNTENTRSNYPSVGESPYSPICVQLIGNLLREVN